MGDGPPPRPPRTRAEPAPSGSGSSSSRRQTSAMNEAPQTPIASSSSGGKGRTTSTRVSGKQFDRMLRNLDAVERSARKVSSRSSATTTRREPGGDSDEEARGEVQEELGEEGERISVPYVIGEDDADEAALRAALAAQQQGAAGYRIEQVTTSGKERTEYYVRQTKASHAALAQGAGKGPDGAALAKAAAKGLKGKENAPPDSFLHEASFVFNPLTRRVPPASPRKVASVATEGKRKKSGLSREMPRSGAASPAGPSTGEGDEPLPLASADKEVQEALILEDLLFVLMGIEGQYITYAPSYSPDDPAQRLRGASFIVDPALDHSLRNLVERILPLAKQYTAIYAFVETDSSLEYGTVTHALCSGIRELLKEYEVLVVQLEHQLNTSPSLTLQKFWFFIHPTIRTISLAHSLVMELAGITHATWLEDEAGSDEEGSDSGADDDDEDDTPSDDSLEREKRALLGLDEDDDDVPGGIAKGGEVLSIIWERAERMSGDPTAHHLYRTLFHRAAQPYARILTQWISTGRLSDPYDEFMIVENSKITVASLESDPTDEYWERRYMLRDEAVLAEVEQRKQQGLASPHDEDPGPRGLLTGGARIPSFLQPWKRKILLAGKYLNVVRECGRELEAGEGEATGEMSLSEQSFFLRIDDAYHRANAALLQLLVTDHSIVARLRSMKHYFLLDSSDFFSSFVEAAGRELRKRVDPMRIREVTAMRLQSHLGMVLGSSSSVGFADPFREDVKIDLASENAYDQLKRIADTKGGIDVARAEARARDRGRDRERELLPLMELLQFDLTVKFPVSLVISKKNILRWQFLQRPILHLKSAERALADVWLEHQDPIWKDVVREHPELERWKRRVFALRHRILFFVQQVLVYVTAQVLEPNWRDLEDKLARARTVDQFMKDHFDFLNTCRKECMLTNVRYVEMLAKLMQVAAVFCDNRVRFRDQLTMERAAAAASDAPPRLNQAVLDFIAKLEKSWDGRLSIFRDIVALLSTTDNPAGLPLSLALQSA